MVGLNLFVFSFVGVSGGGGHAYIQTEFFKGSISIYGKVYCTGTLNVPPGTSQQQVSCSYR